MTTCTRRTFLLGLTGLGFLPSLRSSSIVRITLPTPKPSPSLDLSRLLDAIAQIETGGDDRKVGPSGERSKFQIRANVWRQHLADKPFTLCKGWAAEMVAEAHIEWLDATIPRATPLERDFRPYVLSWAWHGGRDSWLRQNRLPWRRRVALNDYATRVCNLYDLGQ